MHTEIHWVQRRTRYGQLAAFLNAFLAGFVVLAIALLAFDLTRFLLAREQLTTDAQNAALACASTLAASLNPSPAQNQSAASTALKLFSKNTVLGASLSNARLVSPSELKPALNQPLLSLQFLNPISLQPITGASQNDTNIKASAAYSYRPVFATFIGLGSATFPIVVSATSNVRSLDLVVVLDISGGTDDQTNVTLTQRYWDYNSSPQALENAEFANNLLQFSKAAGAIFLRSYHQAAGTPPENYNPDYQSLPGNDGGIKLARPKLHSRHKSLQEKGEEIAWMLEHALCEPLSP